MNRPILHVTDSVAVVETGPDQADIIDLAERGPPGPPGPPGANGVDENSVIDLGGDGIMYAEGGGAEVMGVGAGLQIVTGVGGAKTLLNSDRGSVAVAALRAEADPFPQYADVRVEPVEHAWAFGDAAQPVHTATVARRLVRVVNTVRAGMNGTAPLFQFGRVGTGSPPSDIIAAGDSDPTTANLYEIDVDYPVAIGDQLFLTITPAGSTAGNGLLTLFFV